MEDGKVVVGIGAVAEGAFALGVDGVRITPNRIPFVAARHLQLVHGLYLQAR